MTKTIFCATLAMGCVLILPIATAQTVPSPAQPATPPAQAATTQPDHASSYYHYGLAKIYEDQAVANGRQDLATQAIEQYKLALEADPDSETLRERAGEPVLPVRPDSRGCVGGTGADQ